MNQTPVTSPVTPSIRRPPPGTLRAPPRVAIVSACWHRDIVMRGTAAMRAALAHRGVPDDQVHQVEVPGAFEIPLHAQRLARSGAVDAVIACAFVVNGGIYRHEFVAGAVIDGLMHVQLASGVPVFSAVLTPRDFHEHEEHRRFFLDHFVVKGTEAANACLDTLESLAALAPAVARAGDPGQSPSRPPRRGEPG
jgi:6,7-dimethyl-8-ribityllumazine synthase